MVPWNSRDCVPDRMNGLQNDTVVTEDLGLIVKYCRKTDHKTSYSLVFKKGHYTCFRRDDLVNSMKVRQRFLRVLPTVLEQIPY